MMLDVREIQRFITLGKISLAVRVKFLWKRKLKRFQLFDVVMWA